jgi:hypothetical protein
VTTSSTPEGEPPVPRRTSSKAAVIGVLAALAAAAAPSAAGAASPRCEAKAGDTIARNTTTRVFQRVSGTVENGQDVRIYSCRLGTRSAVLTTRLHNDLDGELRLDEAILGSSRYLVIVFAELTGTSDSTDVFLYDLSAPDRRIFTLNRDGSRQGMQVVVTRHGGVAVLDAGAVTVHDNTGGRVAATSGASELGRGVGDDTVYWTAGGAAASTVLSGHPSDD